MKGANGANDGPVSLVVRCLAQLCREERRMTGLGQPKKRPPSFPLGLSRRVFWRGPLFSTWGLCGRQSLDTLSSLHV